MGLDKKPNQASLPVEPKFDERHTWSQNPYHTQDHRHVAFTNGAKLQHAKLAPIINAQAERLKAAEGLVERLENHLQSTTEWSKMNEYPEHEVRYHLCVDVPGEAMNMLSEIEKFRKGEG